MTERIGGAIIEKVGMEKALELINQLKKEGLIKDYAICGAIAVSYYTEPVLSLDLDILLCPWRRRASFH